MKKLLKEIVFQIRFYLSLVVSAIIMMIMLRPFSLHDLKDMLTGTSMLKKVTRVRLEAKSSTEYFDLFEKRYKNDKDFKDVFEEPERWEEMKAWFQAAEEVEKEQKNDPTEG